MIYLFLHENEKSEVKLADLYISALKCQLMTTNYLHYSIPHKNSKIQANVSDLLIPVENCQIVKKKGTELPISKNEIQHVKLK